MGLFDKLKRDIKHTAQQALLPKDMVTYRKVQFRLVSDEASLPDDKKVLLQMAKYYNDHIECIDLENREEKRREQRMSTLIATCGQPHTIR